MSHNNPNKVLVVLNPISGGIDKMDIKRLLNSMAKTHRVDQEVIETTGKQDQKKISSKISTMKPDLVIVGGGDGTINLVAKCLITLNIPMGVLPLGSANGLAAELEIDANLEDAYDIAINGETMQMDVVQVNDSHISLHLSDIGFNANLVKRFESEEQRGKAAYAKHFFKEYLSSKSNRYYFKVNGDEFSRKAMMVVFANATKYGTGAILNPQGKLDDDKFEVCIIKPYPWYAIFGMTWNFFVGDIHKSRYVKVLSTDFAEVKVKKRLNVQVDGEVLGAYSRVTARVLDDKIKIRKPRNK